MVDVIGELASVCPGPFLSALFKKVVQRLLIAVQKSGEEEKDDDDNDDMDDSDGNKDGDNRAAAAAATDETEDSICALLGLSRALVSSRSLDDASLDLLRRSVRPLMRTDAHPPRVQK